MLGIVHNHKHGYLVPYSLDINDIDYFNLKVAKRHNAEF